MLKPAPPAPEDERRAFPRIAPKNLSATLESRIFLETVSVIDIGRRGFSVRTMISHPPGERLKLHIPGFEPLFAVAVWHSQMRQGARFNEPLDEALLTSLSGED